MTSGAVTGSRQLLTFLLDQDIFALPIDRVREVVEFSHVTKVPKARPYVRGLLNLRGSIIPVVDLRAKLGIMPTERTVNTCVIVIEIVVAGNRLVVGALADSVREVTELRIETGENVPAYGLDVPATFLEGIGQQDDRLVLLLEPDRLFLDVEVSLEEEHVAA